MCCESRPLTASRSTLARRGSSARCVARGGPPLNFFSVAFDDLTVDTVETTFGTS
jgi:hypothetical protein